MKTKEKISFKPGDKIFAKVKGFVYWPARVNPIPEEVIIPPNKIPIFFYGTHEVYFISPSSCFPFDDKNKARWGKSRTRSHFNEGMDEIENNPILLQYGVDPKAEEYLAQFYDFKRNSDTQNTVIRSETNSIDIKDDLKKSNIKKEITKERNKSCSSISTKENKSIESMKNEAESNEIEVIEVLKEENKKEIEEFKDKLIDETSLIEELKDEKHIQIIEDLKNEVVGVEVLKDAEILPKLRSRSKSSTKIEPKKRKTQTNKSDEGSDSEAVSSDNLKDEDFEPAKKTVRVSAKVTTKTRRKSEQTEKVPRALKRKVKPIRKVPLKAKKDTQINDNDSLSSISSIEDWKEKDEKRKKEYEESQKLLLKEELLKEEQAIKEATRQARKKSHSKSSVGEEKVDRLLSPQKKDSYIKPDISENITQEELSLNGKEVIVQISIRDIGKSDVNDKSVMESADKMLENSVLLRDESKLQEITNEKYLNNTIKESELSQNDKTPERISEEKSLDNILEKKDLSPSDKNNNKVSQNKRISKRQPKKERVTSKKTISNRKRQKLDSDESDHESIIINKRSKLNLSEDSDCEIINDGIRKTKISHNSENDSTTTDVAKDKVKKLHSFNSDIRFSLVLGHEDYTKCVNTFRNLCTMELDVLSLVSVWQLMDTVKKCRRYKRNQSVKNEAQNVYKRFLDVYSKSTAEERHKAEATLLKYRHGYNVASEHTSSKIDSAVNGHSQNLSMPSSVEDMFHNKQANQLDHKITKVNVESVEPPKKIDDISLSPNTQKEQLDAEKMRLLSADLEAKVSDILNKIEKNSSLSNPINQQSLSHLLPQHNKNSSIIDLPVKWEPVKDVGRRVQERRKIVDIDHDMDGSDDDEDDVEAIVKRIENVPIKMIEVVDPEEEEEEQVLPPSGSTSALDWRIENLFNSKNFITTPNNTKKELHDSAVKKHRPSKIHSLKSNDIHNPSPPRVIVTEGKDETTKEVKKKLDLLETAEMLEDGEIIDAVEPDVVAESKSADNDIYDLLGV